MKTGVRIERKAYLTTGHYIPHREELIRLLLDYHMSVREIGSYLHVCKTTVHKRIQALIQDPSEDPNIRHRIAEIMQENKKLNNGLIYYEAHDYPEDYESRRQKGYPKN